MALPLAPITNLNGSAIGVINNNSTKLVEEFGKTFYKDGSVNMDGPIDMDSNRIINLPRATSLSSPVTLEQFLAEKKGDQGLPGLPGVGGNTFQSLASLKLLNPATYASAILADGTTSPTSYAYVAGNFTGKADDVNVVQLTAIPLSTGALVRQGAASLTTLSSVTGAIPRSQQSQNNEIVSVLSFGADPTGVLDSTAAFNLATSATATHVGNATTLKRAILVPAGTYRIDGLVYVRRGQQLIGQGLTSSYIDFTQSITARGFVLGCGPSGVVDPGGLGVLVTGLFFYGNASPAVDASRPDSWGVLDCMLTECGVGVRAGGTDGNISRCIFDGGDVGIDLVAGHSHRVQGNLFFNVNTDIRVFSNVCDALISGNIHQYPEIASLQLTIGAAGIRNLIFSNNLCMMNAQYSSHLGFVFVNSTGADFQIKGNSFRNGKSLALSYGGGLGNRFTFSDNDVDGLKTTAVYDQSVSAGGVEVSNMECVIEGNRFTNLAGPAIFCAPSVGTDVQVKGNTFKRNTGGSTEIQIVGANGASAILLDQANFSDRAIVPAQTGVSVFAPRVASGRATLVAGQATIALPLTRTSSRVLIQRYQDGGTVGASYSVSRTPGSGFTIQAKDGAGANQSADTSTVDWTVDLMGV